MADLFHQYADDTGHALGDFAQVALEQGVDNPKGLTYAIPQDKADLVDLAVGDRVVVPLGRSNKPTHGYIIKLVGEVDVDPLKIKEILRRDENHVSLPAQLIELAKWMANYYCCPLGMVFATMLPAAVKHGTGMKNQKYVQLADEISPELDEDALRELKAKHKLSAKQFDILKSMMTLTGEGRETVSPNVLIEHAGVKTLPPLNTLVEKKLLVLTTRREVKAVWIEHAIEPDKKLTLNESQQKVVDRVTAAQEEGYKPFLLHGVTGSGKTEVYIRAIEPVVNQNKVALVLVPEIALTPQTVGRFIGRFKQVAVLHSGLTDAQRHEQWQLIRSGWAQVIVGARSAIFAPIDNLGLIIVDEEHDNSYKQDQLPRYHARDVAIVRAHMAKVPIVLGSATPSLESWHNATFKKTYELLSLPKRVSDLPLPKVNIVDMNDEFRKRYECTGRINKNDCLSLELEHAMRQTFKAGAQAMLLLNRRGYASFIACEDRRCGWTMSCEHCDVQMVYHLNKKLPAGGLVRCHYCQLESLLPSTCPTCNSRIDTLGVGTQRAEEEIHRKFPDVPALRMDSDTMRTGQDYTRTLEAFKNGEAQLLLGTQMIAKGLDFPNVKLVGVISTDMALNVPDFRASERTFQLVAQVAGRPGRSQSDGRVYLQTFNHDHPAIELAAQHEYVTFANMELELRQMMKLPPVTRMARIVIRNTKPEVAERDANNLARVLQQIITKSETTAKLLGPLPCSIARIAGYHRYEIQLTVEDAVHLQHVLHRARAQGQLKSDAHTAVDVDPVSLV